MNDLRKLKYQYLIDQQNLPEECPKKTCIPSHSFGYRWTFAPIENPINFLPNILFNRERNIPPRRNSPTDNERCSACALSMFNSELGARQKFLNIPKLNRGMLGYTHVAKGNLDGLGVMTLANKYGHFALFEFKDIDLYSVFLIVAELN